MFQHDNQSPSHNGEHTTTDTTPAEPRDTQTAADDTRYLDRLAELWADHRRCDLSVRYKTGVLLNEKFGDPTTRQKRGDGVLTTAAKRSGQSVSELSRMRNFAHHFKSLDEFVQKHGTKTWTEVKALLPTLRGGNTPEQEGKARPGKNATRTLERVCRSLAKAAEKVGKVESNGLSQDLVRQWEESLRALAGVSSRFGIVVTVGGVREESKSEEVCAAATAG